MNVPKRKMLPLSKQLQLQIQTGTNPVDSQHFNHLCKEKGDKSRFLQPNLFSFPSFPSNKRVIDNIGVILWTSGFAPSIPRKENWGTVQPGCFLRVSRSSNCLKKFVLSSISIEFCNRSLFWGVTIEALLQTNNNLGWKRPPIKSLLYWLQT